MLPSSCPQCRPDATCAYHADRYAQVVLAKAGWPIKTPCPECGAQGPHDTNGSKQDPGACCCACGTHFDVPGDERP